MLVESDQLFFIYRRSCNNVVSRYRINRYELQFLLALSGFLKHLDRDVVSFMEFIDTTTKNPKERNKLKGYGWGCINKGFLGSYEYIRVPGSLSIGFSNLGLRVVTEFHSELKRLSEKYSFNKTELKEPASDIYKRIDRVAA